MLSHASTFFISMLVSVVLCGARTMALAEDPPTSATSPARAVVPTPEAIQAARAEINEAYATELKARTVNERRAACAKLLEAADDERNTPATRYVLLQIVRERSPDDEVIWGTLEQTAARFQVDELELKEAFIPRLSSAYIQKRAPQLVDDLIDAGHFERARRTVLECERRLRQLQDREGEQQLHVLEKHIVQGKTAFEAFRAAKSRLENDPQNRAAAGIVGAYYCRHNRWREGLTYLSTGDNGELASLARDDLKSPTAPNDQFAIAGRWWKTEFKARSVYWYSQCVDSLEGIDQKLAQTRIHEAPAGRPERELSVDEARSAPVDVLSILDLDKDRLCGDWKLSDGVLSAGWGQCIRVELPYSPPRDYEIRASVMLGHSFRDIGEFGFMLPVANNRSAVLWIGCEFKANKSHIGIDQYGGKNHGDVKNPTYRAFQRALLQPDEWHEIRVRASTSGAFQVAIDDRLIYTWSGNTAPIHEPRNFRLLSPAHIGVGTFFTDIRLRSLTIVPLGPSRGSVNRVLDTAISSRSAMRDANTFRGKAYKLMDVDVDISVARKMCDHMGGTLLAISDVQEDRFVASLLHGADRLSWIDADYVDGRWVDGSGRPLTYIPHIDGTPPKDGHLLHVFPTGEWKVMRNPGWYSIPFICEWNVAAQRR